LSTFDEDADDRFRFGTDPELCPDCQISLTRICKFHRSLEEMREFRTQQDKARQQPEEPPN
jgi:hypothetical protein